MKSPFILDCVKAWNVIEKLFNSCSNFLSPFSVKSFLLSSLLCLYFSSDFKTTVNLYSLVQGHKNNVPF